MSINYNTKLCENDLTKIETIHFFQTPYATYRSLDHPNYYLKYDCI